MTRRGALPLPVLALVQDVGSVMALDGAAHRHRKQLFLSLMTPEALQRMGEIALEEWRLAIERWRRADHVVLLDATAELLCRTVCAWAGVPLGEPEAHRRTAEFVAMIEGAGRFGPRNLRGHVRRRNTERWARGLVHRVRSGALDAEGSAVHAIAWHRELDGEPLDERTAGVELLNVIRPTIAIARYLAFAALALHQHPELRPELARSDELLEPFAQEVRRFYPFFPAIPGRVVDEFEWRGHRFPARRWVLLGPSGTNHDPRAWERPGEFRPQRFLSWDGDPYSLVPQGGGDHATGHRCPGEWMTIELLKAGTLALTRSMDYDVRRRDLRIRPSYIPPKPESGFVIRNVRT